MSAMSLLAAARAGFPRVDFDADEFGVTSAHWLFPPVWEIALQTIATLVIVGLLVKFAGPAIKKYYADRTTGIQNDMDQAVEARDSAESEAARVRASLGDIDTERAQMLADAEQQAISILAEGRARIDEEIAGLHVRANAELESAANRTGEELRGQIAVHAGRALDVVVVDSVDAATQQRLIEDFISRVGAGQSPLGQGGG